MIEPTHQAFQDIQKLDNFLTKCNLLFEDPYVEEHPSHNDAVVARRSISYVDEFFRQRGFTNVQSKWLREVTNVAEGEDWSRVSRYIKDANNEFMGFNRMYSDIMRQVEKEASYSKLTNQQNGKQENQLDTRLSKIDEAPSRLTDETRYMSPQMVQYGKTTHNDRKNYNRSQSGANETHTRQQETPDVYASHSHRKENYAGNQQGVMDEELRSQLRLALDKLEDSNTEETTLKDPEVIASERLEQEEEFKRRGEQASKALHDNNPNITDLSDINRPSKIAERFSNLYDDLWTDACEELTKFYRQEHHSERICILDLATILKATFEYSSKHVDTQIERIAHQTREMMLDPCSDRQQETDSNDPFRHDKTLGQYALICIKDTADLSVPALQKNFMVHAFPSSKVTANITKLSSVKKYTERCIELTWLMNVQDPSMVLLWPDMVSPDNLTDIFRYYTATGTVLDHEVWPALLLYKDGPMVVKGVAKFRN
ncbi:unnamed protein product [Mytilus edulis]|uniref:Mitochondria-eating protein C-terminal domain-containing protein n=2 Tax=Mytilus TaxID=6548 RepID=A0A8S3PRW5_MYTED|nr:unnamed protein product [Mytilus edulis]